MCCTTPEFTGFEATLDRLETTGGLVEQFGPCAAQQEVAKRPTVQQILRTKANGLCL